MAYELAKYSQLDWLLRTSLTCVGPCVGAPQPAPDDEDALF
jgi:hypothetical protein